MPEAPDDVRTHGIQPYTFSIVGAQKAATTTLSGMLDRHRQVCRSPRKEVHFFDDDARNWEEPDYGDYAVPRRKPHHVAMGDASPRYIFWPQALERMHAYNPDMRLIALFRDPLDRLASHWVMMRQRHGAGFASFAQMAAHRPAELPREPSRREAGSPSLVTKSAVLRGYYGQQLRHGFEVYPREQWLLLDFSAFLGDHHGHLDRVTDHIGVHRFRTYPELSQKMSGDPAKSAAAGGGAPTGEEVLDLARFFEPHVAEYAELSGLPVDHWTTTRILRGDVDPAEQAHKYAAKAGLGE